VNLIPGRVVTELRELAALTSNEHGAQRVAWTDTWRKAREWMRGKLQQLPVEIEQDEAGNVWATIRGSSPKAVLIGGHIDSVPSGGWLDGALNLVAGLEVLRRVAAEGVPQVTLRLVDWADEEGARFGRTCFGSGCASGSIRPEDVRDRSDRNGIKLPDALSAFGIDLEQANKSRRQLADAEAYLELHIEQGPVLERRNLPLGVVTGTAGVERHIIWFRGETAHAGSTPMSDRHDSLVAATHVIQATRRAAEDEKGVGTVGTVNLSPGIITAVPGECDIGLDMRHPEKQSLARMLSNVKAAAKFAEKDGIAVRWETLWQIDPIPFDGRLIEFADKIVRDLTDECPHLVSGALHDAAEAAKAGVPTVMLFVQSLRGISHSKAEDTKPEHIELAVKALDGLTSLAMISVEAN
jgi:hydantoinase/carbamoylase family amidase